jgi:hypothetical protein
MTMSPLTWLLLAASFAATAVIWVRVLRAKELWYFKAAGLVISAIPFVGPIFYLFIDMPSRLPPEQQPTMFPRGTQPYPSFTPLINFITRAFGGPRKRKG